MSNTQSETHTKQASVIPMSVFAILDSFLRFLTLLKPIKLGMVVHAYHLKHLGGWSLRTTPCSSLAWITGFCETTSSFLPRVLHNFLSFDEQTGEESFLY